MHSSNKKFNFHHIALLSMAVTVISMTVIASGKDSSPTVYEEVEEAVDTVAVEDTHPVEAALLLIPQRDLDLLTPSMREEMMISFNEGADYKTTNIYGGKSWIEDMNEDYMKVRLTEVSDLQIKALPGFKDPEQLIMTIYTISGESDTADSTIKFYNLTALANDTIAMKELPRKKFFELPHPKDFYDFKAGDLKAGNAKMTPDEIMEEMPFHTVAYTVSPKELTMTGRQTISNYLTIEASKKIEPYIRPELKWIWTGKKFKLVN